MLTGAVLLEQSKGNFGSALAFGIILLAMMVTVNVLFTWVQLGMRRDEPSRVEPQIRAADTLLQPWTQR